MDKPARNLLPGMVCGSKVGRNPCGFDMTNLVIARLDRATQGLWAAEPAFSVLPRFRRGIQGLLPSRHYSVIPGLFPCAVKIDVEVPVTVGMLLLGARRTLRPPV
jgi:hypothetical protein